MLINLFMEANIDFCLINNTEKKQGAILKNGATLEGGAVFFLNNHV